MHPSSEILSAYLDGELEPSETAKIERHVLRCGSCAEVLTSFSHLEKDLSAVPALSCASALPLVSAAHDGQLDPATARLAAAHLEGCTACQAETVAWTAVDDGIARMPLFAPPASVDAALERFRRAPVRARRTWGIPSAPWPARALAAATVAVALMLSLAQQAPLEVGEPVLVASVQQSVLNPRTGTLYVLHAEEGAVAALDAATLATRSIIAVGGRPTALALNEPANQILVLDAQAKSVTTIDGDRNSVVTATTVDVPGTPTSIQVDSGGRVVVASIITVGSAGPAASDAPRAAAPPSGAVSVIDPATNQVQTVNQFDVAPRQFVIDPSGKRALLVSAGGTTIVDAATYKPLSRAPGGIAAAFSGVSGDFAILALRDGSALVTLSSQRSVALTGSPRAITALPDGGYAVLTDVAGKGRVTKVAGDGSIEASVDAPSGRDITFETGNLAVIGPAGISVVALPTSVVAQPSSAPSSSAPAVVSPLVSSPPGASIAPAQSVAPSASASPAAASPLAPASASPSAPTSPAPTLPPFITGPVALPSPASLVPTGGRLLTGDTYLYTPSRGARPTRVAGDGLRIWTIDAANRLSAMHTTTGEIFQVATLPAEAKIAQILPASGYVYLTDPNAGKLYVFTVRTDQLASYPIPFLALLRDAATSRDDRLWFVADGFGLVSFDPRSHRTEVADIGGGFSAVGVDAGGHVWVALRDRGTIALYDPFSGTYSEMLLPHDGTITAIVLDRMAGVWVGTDTGQVIAIRNGRLATASSVGRAIDRLMLGPKGDVWYVSHAGGEVTFGPADGSALAVHGPQGMSQPMFDGFGRAWAEDPLTGAFFVTLRAEGR